MMYSQQTQYPQASLQSCDVLSLVERRILRTLAARQPPRRSTASRSARYCWREQGPRTTSSAVPPPRRRSVRRSSMKGALAGTARASDLGAAYRNRTDDLFITSVGSPIERMIEGHELLLPGVRRRPSSSGSVHRDCHSISHAPLTPGDGTTGPSHRAVR
jgi:hypothetical protein